MKKYKFALMILALLTSRVIFAQESKIYQDGEAEYTDISNIEDRINAGLSDDCCHAVERYLDDKMGIGALNYWCDTSYVLWEGENESGVAMANTMNAHTTTSIYIMQTQCALHDETDAAEDLQDQDSTTSKLDRNI